MFTAWLEASGKIHFFNSPPPVLISAPNMGMQELLKEKVSVIWQREPNN